MLTRSKEIIFALLLVSNVSSFAQTQNCTNCGVGENNPEAKLEVKGCGNTDATKSLQITNNDDEESLVVTDAGNVLVNDGVLAFRNGVGLNLVSQYVNNLDYTNPNGGYVSINTNIAFQNNAMMSAIKITYWSYGYNYDIHVGWYTYGTPLTFYSPNAYISGVAPASISDDIILSDNNGKARISIPYSFFQGYGNLSVSSENSAIYINDDWYNGWTIDKNIGGSGVSEKSVDVKDRIGKSSTNLATANQTFSATRTHNLNQHGLRFMNGEVAIGNTVPSSSTPLIVATNSHTYASIIRNQNEDMNGLMVDLASNKSNKTAFLVRGETDLSKHLFSVKANGNVGVGISVPTATLDVGGTGVQSRVFATSAITNGPNNSPWYGMGRSNATDLSTANNSGAVQVAGYYGLRLKTSGGELNLHQNGNVGIGTVDPKSKLDVRSDAIGAIFKTANNADTDGFSINRVSGTKMTATLKKSTSDVEFRAERTTSSGATAILKAANNLTIVGSETPDPLSLIVNNQSKLYINGYGQIGMGTTNPDASLKIEGDARIRLKDSGNSNTIQWDINQAGADGLVIEKVGATGYFKLKDDGMVEIKKSTSTGSALRFKSGTLTSNNYLDFYGGSSRQAWTGQSGGNYHINKENGGDIIVHGSSSGDIVLENAKKVKIKEIMNLPILTTLPTSGNEVGDVVIIETITGAKMHVYLSGGWSPLQ